MPKRIKEAKTILKKIPAKYAFISGSFLYNEKYNDIDIFAITRKKIPGVQCIDFNQLNGLFYHSISKCCIAKNPLPKKQINATISKLWESINEAVPELLNKNQKQLRSFILQKEYFENNKVLDSYEIYTRIKQKITLKEIQESKNIFIKTMKKSYLLRYFHTQAGIYRKPFEYSSQEFLYDLTQQIIHGT